jgi:predicted nucleotidyltransferase
MAREQQSPATGSFRTAARKSIFEASAAFGTTMKSSLSLKMHMNEVGRILERRGMRNPRLFGSTARGEDTGRSDVDILVEAPPGTSLFDLADAELELEKLLGCKVEVMTRGFLAPDVAECIEADLIPLS